MELLVTVLLAVGVWVLWRAERRRSPTPTPKAVSAQVPPNASKSQIALPDLASVDSYIDTWRSPERAEFFNKTARRLQSRPTNDNDRRLIRSLLDDDASAQNRVELALDRLRLEIDPDVDGGRLQVLTNELIEWRSETAGLRKRFVW